jgi:hypothetical protein
MKTIETIVASGMPSSALQLRCSNEEEWKVSVCTGVSGTLFRNGAQPENRC